MMSFFTANYPYIIAIVFCVMLGASKGPAKIQFFLRALVAVGIAVALAHVNRWFRLDPEHLLFPSGHMTFCLGVSISLGMLAPWTLAISLPLLIPMGFGLVEQHYHTTGDVLGAFPLVAIVYGTIHWFWRVPSAPSLDMTADST